MSDIAGQINVESLPKQFVSSLRVLFDILDEERTGYVRLVDIETRWNGEGVRGLPVGVVEALRKVTPSSGFLSFERFVMGLKLAMFKNKHSFTEANDDNRRTPTNELSTAISEPQIHNHQHSDGEVLEFGGRQTVRDADTDGNRGGRVSVIQLHHIHPSGQSDQTNLHSQRTYGAAITATVRPNNAINTASAGQVLWGESESRQPKSTTHAKQGANLKTNMYSSCGNINGANVDRARYTQVVPPPRPLRAQYSPTAPPSHRAQQLQDQPSKNPLMTSQEPMSKAPQIPPRDYRKSAKSVIINELKQWQRERQQTRFQPPAKPPRITSVSSDSKLVSRVSNPNQDIYVNLKDIAASKLEEQAKEVRPTSKVQARRRDPRRHTVANGVDYNMVKRVKQIDEEKSLLKTGCETAEKALDWCRKQIISLDERQRNVGNPTPQDFSIEDTQTKINQLRVRVNEFVHHACLLMDNTDQNLVGPMNLAVKSVPLYNESITINMLKEQNRQLTKEVGDKGERITQLQREKASLIREMFEGRALAKNKTNYDDTTFM